jgi:hypothetical protein
MATDNQMIIMKTLIRIEIIKTIAQGLSSLIKSLIHARLRSLKAFSFKEACFNHV